jgi:hypothetical protein
MATASRPCWVLVEEICSISRSETIRTESRPFCRVSKDRFHSIPSVW